jgi:hypothetical protein
VGAQLEEVGEHGVGQSRQRDVPVTSRLHDNRSGGGGSHVLMAGGEATG